MIDKKIIVTLVFLYAGALTVALFQIVKHKGPGGLKSGLSSALDSEGPAAIAVVPIYGVISIGDESSFFGSKSSDHIARRLKSLSEREEVKAVVLRINSPGGTVGAVQEIHDGVLQLKKSGKKVLVSFGDIAASGGYYVAAAADKIFAEPGTITGSIGVIFQSGNVQDLFKKMGVQVQAIKSAEHKDIGSPFRTMTEKERKILQSLIDDAYHQFVDAVAEGRKMQKEKALSLADGRIFTGSQAKAEGLVDELGGLQTALAKATEMAGIKEKPKIIYEEESPFQKFFSLLSQAQKGRGDLWETSFARFGVRFAYLWEYSL